MLTDGITRPRSIWEIIEAETPSRRLSSRTPIFCRSRSLRSRVPSSLVAPSLLARSQPCSAPSIACIDPARHHLVTLPAPADRSANPLVPETSRFTLIGQRRPAAQLDGRVDEVRDASAARRRAW